MPVLPVTATLSVGSVDAALAPATPASPTTQAATTLDTTISDPSRFTTCSSRLSRGTSGVLATKQADQAPEHRVVRQRARRPNPSGPASASSHATTTIPKPRRKLRRGPNRTPHRGPVGVSLLVRERRRRRGCELLRRSAAWRGLAAGVPLRQGSAGARRFVGNRPVSCSPARQFDEAMSVRRVSVSWLLVVIAVAAIAVFVAVTIFVTRSSSLAFDSRAFEICADDVRAAMASTAPPGSSRRWA